MPPGCRRPAASPPDPHMKGCIFTEQDFREDREREMRAGEFGRAGRKALKFFSWEVHCRWIIFPFSYKNRRVEMRPVSEHRSRCRALPEIDVSRACFILSDL